MSEPRTFRWQPDQDDARSIDDLFAKGCDVHLERMDDGFYWIGITLPNGETIHIDIVNRRDGRGRRQARINAYMRDETARSIP